MDIRQITPDFFTAPQIVAEDMPQIAAYGIKLVLCNRPDSEIPPDLQAAALAQAAAAAGVDYVVQPLTHQNMTPDVIAANFALIDACDGPVLAYCASGTRSTIAWALGATKGMSADAIINAARTGGYDLEHLRPTLLALEASKD
ncbi:Beta-lactamase hydrolase-like protein [Roseobacter fucihabitans]|uniref:Beta-lactamase hydrolase-like protein n=1 Tax=Roseobacter fucihabitans TaxID=1537242 RepID=A0ABZ2BSL3_9RHOB|nr:TIGR01244 family sulfur transferase [Roseobacter litoralis]MBC6964341.1 Beta-lactamase hydrolase-like protein [Roseobacter litoralis]